MDSKIKDLTDHHIVCGAGLTGQYVMDELTKTHRSFVVVEQDPAEASRLAEAGVLVICGDASRDDILKRAGIESARGLAACLPTDKDNLFAVITAKGLNPKLRVVSKIVEKDVREKMLRSGADAVVSPSLIGGLRLASELVRPTVVTFLDKMLRAGDESFRVEEVLVHAPPSHPTLGKVLSHTGHDLLVLAVRPKEKDDYLFNPKPDTALQMGDVLVVIGAAEDVKKLQKSLN